MAHEVLPSLFVLYTDYRYSWDERQIGLALAGLAGPAMQALATRRVQADEQGRLQGALSSLRGIAMMLGPLLFTQSLASALRAGAPPLSGVPFLLAALLLVGSGIVASRVTSGERKRAERRLPVSHRSLLSAV